MTSKSFSSDEIDAAIKNARTALSDDGNSLRAIRGVSRQEIVCIDVRADQTVNVSISSGVLGQGADRAVIEKLVEEAVGELFKQRSENIEKIGELFGSSTSDIRESLDSQRESLRSQIDGVERNIAAIKARLQGIVNRP